MSPFLGKDFVCLKKQDVEFLDGGYKILHGIMSISLSTQTLKSKFMFEEPKPVTT